MTPKKNDEKSIDKLKRELSQAWKDIETLPITEIAARNASVHEYCQHWEGRAIKAEDELEQLRQRVAELEGLLKEAYAYADEVLRPRVAELEKEVAQWKNHHETEVRRARILKERTDMPIERVQAYEQWGKDQARIAELEKELSDCGNLGLRSCAEIDNLTTERNELLEANKAMADDLIDRHDRIAELTAERDAGVVQMSLLSDEEIKAIAPLIESPNLIRIARAIESAILDKLKAQEPFRWFYEVNGTWDICSKECPPDDAYDEGSLKPLYLHPIPADGVVRQRDELLREKNYLLLNAEVAMRCLGDMGTSKPAVKAYAILQEAIASVKGGA